MASSPHLPGGTAWETSHAPGHWDEGRGAIQTLGVHFMRAWERGGGRTRGGGRRRRRRQRKRGGRKRREDRGCTCDKRGGACQAAPPAECPNGQRAPGWRTLCDTKDNTTRWGGGRGTGDLGDHNQLSASGQRACEAGQGRTRTHAHTRARTRARTLHTHTHCCSLQVPLTRGVQTACRRTARGPAAPPWAHHHPAQAPGAHGRQLDHHNMTRHSHPWMGRVGCTA